MLQERELLNRMDKFRKRKDEEFPSLAGDFMDAYTDVKNTEDDHTMDEMTDSSLRMRMARHWSPYKTYRVRTQH